MARFSRKGCQLIREMKLFGVDSNKKVVMDWIASNFDTSQISVDDWPVLPGGTLITDATGATMLVWHDIANQKVCYEIR